ncbi:MAG: DEAD/DEAH box helicase [Chloroflexales bacterium]|nr:DEAD/DEAH box helicase [Chloroflexales bacterium]
MTTPGTIIAGRYRIDAPLGRGGMGTVYRGWDTRDELPVAVKVLAALDPDAIQQFTLEAELLAQLRSPHVPRVYAALQPPAAPGYTLVMEYVAGEDLESIVEQRGPLDEARALQIMRQILQALVHLHSQRPPIIHRDLKPANLRLDRFGNAWLLDLGIGKRVGNPTLRGGYAATLAYAPPEQLQPGRSTDTASDLFALGATMFHLLAGAPPPDALARLQGAALPDLARLRPGTHPATAALLSQLLALEPGRRPASAAAAQEEVERLVDPTVAARDRIAAQFQRGISQTMPQALRAVRTLPAQQAVTREVDPPLPPAVARAYGGHPLYRHQAEAIERARRRRDIVVVTGTASGKSLCYNLPILERCLGDPRARALYLFPIKALINDQAHTLEGMLGRLGDPTITAGRLHGDLSQAERQTARTAPPRLALSNPEMVHWMLARHPNWRTLFARLQFIVLDEVHTYRGVFGSHMAQLLRRLLRICRYYGAQPQIIACSATVANPAELVERLTGRSPFVIDRDGAARVRRHVVFWQPIDIGAGVRRPADDDAVLITEQAVAHQQQVITFARSRSQVETMLLQARDGAHAGALRAYRGGYTRHEREAIERGLRDGSVRAVFSTNALEMGIDIGGLQTSVLTGFPGSRMSFWQQAGRAGRRGEDAHVIFVGGANPLDQFYLQRPDDLLFGPAEVAVVDLDNRYIAEPHLCCMARELPIRAAEAATLPPESLSQLDELLRDGVLVAQDDGRGGREYVYAGADLPHRRVALRAASRISYTVICPEESPEPLETIEPPNLYLEAHAGAILYHQGRGYRVRETDHAAREVRVAPEPSSHTTKALVSSDVMPSATLRSADLRSRGIPATVSFGRLQAAGAVTGFREYQRRPRRQVREEELPAPLVFRLETMGCWLDIAPELQQEVDRLVTAEQAENALAAALHGLEHLLLGLMPTLALCDRRDLGSWFVESYGEDGAARVYLYDSYPGGIGLAERGFTQMERLLERAYDVVIGCPCPSGCPQCIQAGWCTRELEPLDKEATVYLLARLLGRRGPVSP